MTDIIIVVDAQNSFCHPDGVDTRRFAKTEKKLGELKHTIAHIKLFLENARMQNVPVIYFCANENATNVALWNLQIHNDLKPREGEEVLWRNNPEDDRALDITVRSLSKKFFAPHFFLCGFYTHYCVTRVALHALKVEIPVAFVVDCAFPRMTQREQKSFSFIQEQVSFNFDASLARFVQMSAIFPDANPPVSE
ncbi:MAG: isochorismatase family protein [Parcubacteria group bacterium]|nr:isochorismatase family protein [Parcubacteria group bacterium]